MFGEDCVSSKDGSVLCITVDGKTANISLDNRVCTAKHSLLCVLCLAEASLQSSIQICLEYHVPIAKEIILYLVSKQLKPVHFPLFPLTFSSVDQYPASLRETLTQPVSWAHWVNRSTSYRVFFIKKSWKCLCNKCSKLGRNPSICQQLSTCIKMNKGNL